MIRYKYKAEKDHRWLMVKSFNFPDGLNPGSVEELTRRAARKPLGTELEERRRQHMLELYVEGASYALIAKLYRLDRSLVRKIIKGVV